ncbi:MAG: hypothetical protein PHR47_02560 [Candidatus Pacebacteria bacterium]|nr:hypothetical protein [Candidatus Paceibacterota bacterium]
MIIGLTGLHGCGKSHIANILEKEFNCYLIDKRKSLEKYFSKQFFSVDSQESIEWYRSIYKEYGPATLINLLIEHIPNDKATIIDAIHNPIEWNTIKEKFPSSLLVGVFSPHIIRIARNNPQDILLDIKRINYWHCDNQCLLSSIEWAFTGLASASFQKKECEVLMHYLKIDH